MSQSLRLAVGFRKRDFLGGEMDEGDGERRAKKRQARRRTNERSTFNAQRSTFKVQKIEFWGQETEDSKEPTPSPSAGGERGGRNS
jgi:hypothetical protein